MKKIQYTEGQKFGKLTFIRDSLKYYKIRKAVFQCYCGKEFESRITHVKNGSVKSCGCSRIKHGLCLTDKRLYSIYIRMVHRCTSLKGHASKWYSKKGIKVCDDWLNSPQSFIIWAKENGYSSKLSIERLDNNKGYSPENCSWIPRIEQCRNRSNTKLNWDIVKEIRESKETTKSLSIKYNLSKNTIHKARTYRSWVKK